MSLHLHKEILSLPLFETASEGCRKLLSLTIKVKDIDRASQLDFFCSSRFLSNISDIIQDRARKVVGGGVGIFLSSAPY